MSHVAHLWELRYEHGTSYKFYRVYTIQDAELNDFRVLCQWGRIGTRGQSKVETFSSAGGMHTIAIEKRDEKLKKGYSQTAQYELHPVPPEVLRLAAVNERSQLQAQEAVDTNMAAAMMAKLDAAVRLATGTSDDLAQATVLRGQVAADLDILRAQVARIEGTAEALDDLIMSKLG